MWQGSDFDLGQSLQQAVAGFANLSLADTLNALAPFKPIVARRATIETGTLRSFTPYFASSTTRCEADTPRIVFYLAEENEALASIQPYGRTDILAVCRFTERLREVVITQLALQELPKHHAALHQDPVAQREYRDWLQNATLETGKILRNLLESPESLQWQAQGKAWMVDNPRALQQQLSHWMTEYCYPQAPTLRNELVNWDQPTPSANTGRKRLINAMLAAAHQADLGIEKTPAEMSLYLSLLKHPGLHRESAGRWGFYEPDFSQYDPCHMQPIWNEITRILGDAGARQVPVIEIYQTLRQPPFGVKLGLLPILLMAYFLTYRRAVALYQEGVFCDEVTLAQTELWCKRPELFALERFDLAGLRGDLFNRYLGTIVGKVQDDATLLDIVKPLVRFMNQLPPYTLHCAGLSGYAKQVRKVFAHAQSPGRLLFNDLPQACGIDPAVFAAGEAAEIERFIQRLVAALRELNGAYSQLLDSWQATLNRVLLDETIPDLSPLRQALATRYAGLDHYTPDRMGLGAFIRRIGDSGYNSDRAWLESVATLVGEIPPQKWLDETRLQAELRLEERGQQLRDLLKLRLAMPNPESKQGAVLIRLVDPQQGEMSRVVQLTDSQREVVNARAQQIAQGLNDLDESQQFAIVAALLALNLTAK